MIKKFGLLGIILAISAVMLAPRFSDAFIQKGTYTYIHNEGEYSVDLPDAPVGVTIWADQKEPIPFLEDPPKYGTLGEVATVKRVDLDTGDVFEVECIFMKAERDFLLSMTKEKMLDALDESYSDVRLDNKQVSFSSGSDTLKWATMTGFTVDQSNNLLFNASHYLTGLQTLIVIKTKYNVENKLFQSYYNQMQQSIKYKGLK